LTNRFYSPREAFWSSTAPYAGGTLTFYASNSSTPLAVYSDATLSTSITDPIELNSAGRPSIDIFLGDAAYKVVLADSDGVIVWTSDPVSASDFTTTAQFSVYAGSPNGNVAGTAGSGSIPADSVWDTTNNILYICTSTGTASTAVWTAVNAASATPAVPMPQGALTLTSATPVITGDVADAAAVYYTPATGNLMPIYNGSAMIPTMFAELTLTLAAANHAAGGIYDVFGFSNSGVVTVATGPVWTTLTAGSGSRGTGAGTTELTRIAGINVNAVSMTAKNDSNSYTIAANRGTYLGSIFINGTGAAQITCHRAFGQSRKWGVFNAFNRSPILLQCGDATASWTYNNATVRQSRADATNTLAVFTGLREEMTDLSFIQRGTSSFVAATDAEQRIGIGLNVTNAYSGKFGYNATTAAGATTSGGDMIARHILLPAIGINNVNACESVPTTGGGTQTYIGTSASMLLSARWNG
jgi:hypothetical protein